MILAQEIEIHKQITDSIHNLFKSKRADYGSTTEELINLYGPVTMLVFLRTKLSRLDNLLMNNKTPNNESVEDNIIDIANYAIIWLLEIQKEKLKEAKECLSMGH